MKQDIYTHDDDGTFDIVHGKKYLANFQGLPANDKAEVTSFVHWALQRQRLRQYGFWNTNGFVLFITRRSPVFLKEIETLSGSKYMIPSRLRTRSIKDTLQGSRLCFLYVHDIIKI